MKWFLDRPIGTKLILSFLLLALGAGAAGIESLTTMRKMTRADDVLYNRMTVPLAQIGHAAKQFQRVRVNVRDAIYNSDTPEKLQERVQTLDALKVDLDTTLANFEKTIVSERMRERFAALTKARAEFLGVREQTLALRKEGKIPEAVALLNGDMFHRSKAVEQAFEDIQAAKVEDADALALTNAAEAAFSSRLVLIVVVLLVVVAIGFGVVLSRLIGRPMQELTTAARRLAVGDLRAVPVVQRKDETGLLSQAFSEMVVAQQEVATASARLAKGDLSVAVSPRSADDVLGASFSTLHGTLQSLVAEGTRLTAAGTAGELATRADAQRFDGAFRELLTGFNATLDAVIKPVQEAAGVLQRLADRDLTKRVEGAYRGDHAQIKDALNSAIEALHAALSNVAASTGQIASAADQIATTSQSLAQGASEQAASLEETTASLQELSGAAERNASSARSAQSLATQARETTLAGVQEMRELSTAVIEIGTAANKTAQIVKTIDLISFQTNLLALNAAVEAARAGDAGKGFAVVAEEVRALAIRSAEAARQTSELIEQSVTRAARGADITRQVESRLSQIDRQVEGVFEAVGEITIASDGQREGVTQVNVAMSQMNAVTQGVAASAEESSSASEELAGQSQMLAALVAEFSLKSEPRRTLRVA
jgi:methyl-accepting chemotaxis protein